MKAYWNILGIGPWAITKFGQPKCPDMKYYGKPAWGRCHQAMVQLGPIELELLEPLEGVSIYHDWLAEHGEGFHHMKFLVEDLACQVLLPQQDQPLHRGPCWREVPEHLLE